MNWLSIYISIVVVLYLVSTRILWEKKQPFTVVVFLPMLCAIMFPITLAVGIIWAILCLGEYIDDKRGL